MTKSMILALALTAGVSTPCLAQNPGPERLAEVEIRPQRIADDLYVLFGYGGNIAVQLGEQGVLLVDTQFPELVPKIRAAIAEIGGGEIEFAVNTHWHYDHAEGNQGFGPQGVWFVAQSESRRRLTIDNTIDTRTRPAFPQPAYPPPALPIASFEDRMQLHFNGERIDLLHFGPAHTAGDAAVFFRRHNAVHMGDVFLPGGYPFVDADNGGDLDGMIAFCRAVMTELDEDSIVIPGHGPVSTYADLARYTQMLQSVRDAIATLVDSGATLEQVIAAQPTAAWDEAYGDPAAFIDRAYLSLTR
jgi:glyoxylase-like metal-dependent hydrolase (beta-lactamase superfamily II)